MLIAVEATVHWGRANCRVQNSRAAQHELLGGAATGLASLLYLATGPEVPAPDM